MLHELLLSLTGHPSPLLSLDSPDPTTSAVTSLASPSELSLLQSVATLGTLQTAIRTSCASLTSSSIASRTTIASAVAAATLHGPLSAFQTHVGTVERRILSQDAALVGAYRAVPLAAVVAEFDGWERVLTWLRNALLFAQGGADGQQGLQSGAQVLNYLRRESRTGYPDVARVCGQLLRAGEAAWVRQLAAWVLYGRLPDIGKEDFFIQGSKTIDGVERADFFVDQSLLPGFVTSSAAASILFVGQSLHNVQEHLAKEPDARMQMDINTLVQSHLGQLSALEIPIVSAALARTISSIRISLARNALQKLLPMSTIRHVLNVLREFFLLERGEFAMALIGVTDAHLSGRSMASEKHDGRLLGGAMIKEAELSAVMSKTWAALAALHPILPDSMEDYEDEALETARDMISLIIRKSHAKKGETRLIPTENAFEDLLVGIPAVLTMSIASPLDMFLTPPEMRAYSQIHAYLLSLRRAHLHLTSLSNLSVLRRTHPAPHPAKSQNQSQLTSSRSLASSRALRMRGTWAAISAAILLLSELSAYFQGEVVASSWATFNEWIASPTASASTSTSTATPEENLSHDPATLAHAHRRYLTSLARALLLTDAAFTRSLRTLLVRCEHVASLVRRLGVVVRGLVGAEVAGYDDVPEHFAREEQALDVSLRAGRDALRTSIAEVVARVRALETEYMARALDDVRLDGNAGVSANVGTGAGAGGRGDKGDVPLDFQAPEDAEREFVPWKGPGLARLLMRLDVANLDGGRDREEMERLLV